MHPRRPSDWISIWTKAWQYFISVLYHRDQSKTRGGVHDRILNPWECRTRVWSRNCVFSNTCTWSRWLDVIFDNYYKLFVYHLIRWLPIIHPFESFYIWSYTFVDHIVIVNNSSIQLITSLLPWTVVAPWASILALTRHDTPSLYLKSLSGILSPATVLLQH